jgi:RNA polymerase sigma factor (sigma-70 family)
MTKAQSSQSPDSTLRAQPLNWSALLTHHERWLRTVVYARLGSHEGVDEVLQEVSLAAVRQRAPINDPTKAAPWLYRLAVVQSLLYRRTHGRRRKLIDRYAHRGATPEHDAGASDPLVWILADERRRQVRVAIKRLPPRDSEILLLKYTEDWSYHQLAARLGVSHSAVETRLHRARARLRSELMALDISEVNG